MKIKYPYHRVTGTFHGKHLSYEECLSYIESFKFIEKKIPVAIIYMPLPPLGFSRFSVWAWREEAASKTQANIEKLPDNIEIKASFNKFENLYKKYLVSKKII